MTASRALRPTILTGTSPTLERQIKAAARVDYPFAFDELRRRIAAEADAIGGELQDFDFAEFDFLGECLDLLMLRKSGNPIFVIDADLQEELSRTEIGDVRLTDILCPFEMQYVAFSAPVPMNGLMLKGFYCWLTPRSLTITLIDDYGEFDGDRITFRAPVDDTVFLTEMPYRTLEYVQSLREGGHQFFTNKWEDALGALDGDFRPLANLIGATICYLQICPKPVETWSRSQTPVTKKNKREHYIAGEVPVRVVSLPSSQSGISDAENGAPTRQHWRRGHIRRQPVGPRTNPTIRLTWVRPTLVNRGNGDVADTSVYRVSK